MKYDDIPQEVKNVLMKAINNIPTLQSIIAEEIQEEDTIRIALINISERLRLVAFDILETISIIDKDPDYTTKEMIDHLHFDDWNLVDKVKLIEKSDERYYEVEYEDGNKYILSQKPLKG